MLGVYKVGVNVASFNICRGSLKSEVSDSTTSKFMEHGRINGGGKVGRLWPDNLLTSWQYDNWKGDSSVGLLGWL